MPASNMNKILTHLITIESIHYGSTDYTRFKAGIVGQRCKHGALHFDVYHTSLSQHI